jgi:hypothetical protein
LIYQSELFVSFVNALYLFCKLIIGRLPPPQQFLILTEVYIQALTRGLQALNLEGNPLAYLPNYRYQVMPCL